MWRTDPGCEQTVTMAWVPKAYGPPMTQVQTKIRRCSEKLRKWSRDHFGNITRQLKEKTEQLRKAEDESMVGQGHDTVISLRKEVQILLVQEEKMWNQRSRTAWLKDGDRNTRYFHSRASHRRRRNTISAVRLDTGELSTEPDLIRTQFLNYYTGTLYCSSVGRC
jgi:hypothetical protein